MPTAKVYREQGGNLVVGSSGEIRVSPITESTGTALSAAGASVCGSTAAKKLYSIGAPSSGSLKYIAFTVAAATGWVNVSSTGAPFLGAGSTGNSHLKAVGDGGVTLLAASASNWIVVGKSTTVTLTTSTT